jgi:O-antigen biosynthesis protein
MLQIKFEGGYLLSYFSFVFLCYNSWNHSQQAITTAIDSLNNAYFKRGVEIVAVNNGSTDETALGLLKLKRKYKGQVQFKIINYDENLGYPAGINAGLEHCNGEIITILNNDLVFSENWFDALFNTIKNDPTIGVAAPYLSYASGLQNVGVTFNSTEEMKRYARNFMIQHREQIIFLDRIIGACMVIRRKVIETVGGNDLWFGIGNYDDDDWTLRIRMTGFKIALVGSSFVHHIGSVSFNKDPNTFNNVLITNYLKFIKKWNVPVFDPTIKEKLITETAFRHDQHFCPIKMEQYKVPIEKSRAIQDRLKILFVADWSSYKSEWRNKLNELKSYALDGSQLFFWIPANYYHTGGFKDEIKAIVANEKIDMEFLEDNIPQINLLDFLSDFDILVKVNGDFININLKRLAKHLSLDII